jgi:hypothetical protein
MKILLYSFLLFFAANSLYNCEHGHEDHSDSKLGDTIDLPLNESVKFGSEKLEITLVSNADSRCPLNVNCIQAGKAKITLKLTKDGKEEMLELESKGLCQAEDGSCGSTGSVNGYTVKLINVYPYPTEPKTDDAKAVYAKLIVTK